MKTLSIMFLLARLHSRLQNLLSSGRLSGRHDRRRPHSHSRHSQGQCAFQINFTVPNLPAKNYPLVIQTDGVSSQSGVVLPLAN